MVKYPRGDGSLEFKFIVHFENSRNVFILTAGEGECGCRFQGAERFGRGRSKIHHPIFFSQNARQNNELIERTYLRREKKV